MNDNHLSRRTVHPVVSTSPYSCPIVCRPPCPSASTSILLKYSVSLMSRRCRIGFDENCFTCALFYTASFLGTDLQLPVRCPPVIISHRRGGIFTARTLLEIEALLTFLYRFKSYVVNIRRSFYDWNRFYKIHRTRRKNSTALFSMLVKQSR